MIRDSEDDELFCGLISVKGVWINGSKVVLVKNQRGEWELPGGKRNANESLEQCLIREFTEELSVSVAPQRVIGAGSHHFFQHIVVIIYGCRAEDPGELLISNEHTDVSSFSLRDLEELKVVPLYRDAIKYWYTERTR